MDRGSLLDISKKPWTFSETGVFGLYRHLVICLVICVRALVLRPGNGFFWDQTVAIPGICFISGDEKTGLYLTK